MLKTILSVSGKPGLFRLISSGKNMVIVESLEDKRKLPIYARDKVVSLGDIAMYSDEGEVALGEIFLAIHTKYEGKAIAPLKKAEELKTFFAEILPSYDRDRVHDSDIKKLITWYNLLIQYGVSFDELKKKEETSVEVDSEIIENEEQEKKVKKEEKKEEKKETATKAPRKKAAPKKSKKEEDDKK